MSPCVYKQHRLQQVTTFPTENMAICSHTTTIIAARQAYVTNDSLQINDVPYPQYSSDNRSALNPSE
jgi:hypothetical protein